MKDKSQSFSAALLACGRVLGQRRSNKAHGARVYVLLFNEQVEFLVRALGHQLATVRVIDEREQRVRVCVRAH